MRCQARSGAEPGHVPRMGVRKRRGGHVLPSFRSAGPRAGCPSPAARGQLTAVPPPGRAASDDRGDRKRREGPASLSRRIATAGRPSAVRRTPAPGYGVRLGQGVLVRRTRRAAMPGDAAGRRPRTVLVPMTTLSSDAIAVQPDLDAAAIADPDSPEDLAGLLAHPWPDGAENRRVVRGSRGGHQPSVRSVIVREVASATLRKAWNDRILGLSAEAAFWQLLSVPPLLIGRARHAGLRRAAGSARPASTADRGAPGLRSPRGAAARVVDGWSSPTLSEVLEPRPRRRGDVRASCSRCGPARRPPRPS